MTKEVRKRLEWFSLIVAMTLPFCASIFYFKVYSDSPVAGLLYSGTKLFTLAWPIIVTTLLFKEKLAFPKFTRNDFQALPLGGLLGLVVIGFMYAGLWTPVLGDAVYAAGPDIRAKALEMGFAKNFILFAAFLSILHSLIEEYYWRWFVFRRLLELVKPWVAHLLAGIAFASHHVVVLDEYFPLQWAFFFGACTAIGGILWSMLYMRQRTIAGTWFSHMLVDIGIMAIGYGFIKG